LKVLDEELSLLETEIYINGNKSQEKLRQHMLLKAERNRLRVVLALGSRQG
jgi:hypothetical protein